MKKFYHSNLVGAFALLALVGCAGPDDADALADADDVATSTLTDAVTTTRAFICSGVANHSPRPSARETVTGTLASTNSPRAVTVLNYLNAVRASSATLTLENTWWSSYFKTTNHWNQWRLNSTGTSILHLMLPDTTPGATFSGELVEEFFSGGQSQGNWQTPLACKFL